MNQPKLINRILKPFGLRALPVKNYQYFVGAQKEIKTGGKAIEVLPPSRHKRDIGNYLEAIRLAENVVTPTRWALYDIYQESIDYDTHLRSVWDKRVDALLSHDFTYHDEQGNEVEAVKEFMESPKFREFLIDIIETRFWGHSLFEFERNQDFTYTMIPRKNVEPRRGMILMQQSDVEGFRYRKPELERTVMEIGEFDDLGLMLTAARYAIYKRHLVSDWANYSELAGNNFERIVSEFQDEQIMTKMEQFNQEYGAGRRAVVPEGIEIQSTGSSSSSQNQLFEGFHDVINKEISKLFLSQTMTSEGGQSRSQAEVHQFEQEITMNNDLIFVLNILNFQFKDYMELWGMPTNGRFNYIENSSLVEQRELERLEKIAKLKKYYNPEYLQEKFNLPKEALKNGETGNRQEPIPPQDEMEGNPDQDGGEDSED